MVCAGAGLGGAGTRADPRPGTTTAVTTTPHNTTRTSDPEPDTSGDPDLPGNPLVTGGSHPDTLGAWETQHRPQLLEAFGEHVYGHPLPAPDDMTFDVTDLGATDDGAVGKKIVIEVTGPVGAARFTLRLFTPTAREVEREVHGTFLLIDHRGAVTDTGSDSDYAPIAQITGAGHALAVLDAVEVAPDDLDRYRDGVISAFHPAGTELPDTAGRTIAAWAWAASRALDYLHTDDATRSGVDPARVAVIGHSRSGKAALWAGAQDPRFPVVISNNSGAAGAKLADTGRGESIDALTSAFPHWFPPAYRTYAGRPDALPVDQHQLLALIAPGRLVVASATDDVTADPQGEHAAYRTAEPVWALYGLPGTGLPDSTWPPPTDRAYRGPGMSYHLRTGAHGLTTDDWRFYLHGDLFRW
ncbi:acetylxylan esterase [Pseudonocardia sp. ICBG1293]|uniref:glucuronyl esterase domain-containing protein n=1 Tax=Pseudonocardia sp. ICBG1293 TaxID=2844382 RepID=UPI001CCBFB00|nr:acetylxylan esterase [Pseudonocardia sp. ICBG1293]